MSKEQLYIFDTTLRDGAQTQGVDFSIDDKEKISSALDLLGVDYVEGGWPGANPTDTEFFNKNHNFKSTKLTAFGMTKKSEHSAENDPMLSSLINSKSSSVCLFGKSWDFQVKVALGITNKQNLMNISESAKHIVKSGKEFMFDAEHFFDGYKSNSEYALSCLKAAYENGARWIILCDTNGGTLPHEISKIVSEVIKHIPGKNLGIHAHNDTENAVANSLAAVQAQTLMVERTSV
jgi:2-isopropylmalate synthase